MRDQVFEGRDVPEAVAAACRALGIEEASLRYVVLERGAAGSLGMGGMPARIAVLMPGGGGVAPPPPPPPPTVVPRDPRRGIEAVLRAIVETADIEVGATVEESADAVVVRLEGPGARFFLGEGGAVLEATEHLLQRMFGRALSPRRLSLDCAGHREQRELALRSLARELAAAVRTDGAPRTTRPLNSYERRIVHMAVGEEPGLKSYGVGEGNERRVTVALAGEPDEGRG